MQTSNYSLIWATLGILVLAAMIAAIFMIHQPRPQPGIAIYSSLPAYETGSFETHIDIPKAEHTVLNIQRQSVTGGDVGRGRQLLADYGCGSCHQIPGIRGANALVGPPLDGWSQRHYIAGSLPNTLDNLVVWIVNPQGVEPNTAMPTLGVSDEEARHMSAYLYTLGN